MSDETPEIIEAVPPAAEVRAEIVPPTVDTPSMSEVRHFYELMQIDYVRRAGEIEKFLGFMESAEDLGTRLARLENFLGIKAS